jgi:hypothetical protein
MHAGDQRQLATSRVVTASWRFDITMPRFTALRRAVATLPRVQGEPPILPQAPPLTPAQRAMHPPSSACPPCPRP